MGRSKGAIMKVFSFRLIAIAVAVMSVVTLNACGGGGNSGSTPTPVVPAPVPQPTPNPEPTPEPGLSASCAKLPLGDPTAACPQEQATFQAEVDAAIFTLIGEQPELFDGDNKTQSVGAYYVGLIKILDRQGLCAYFDGEELGVTDSPTFNDQYDILTAGLQVRTGPRTYRTTCYPSAVPPPEAPLQPSPAGCSLPPSREVGCSREADGKFFFQVEGAVMQVMEERPELFNFNDHATATNWPRVLDLAAYQQAVVDVLASQGFCAKDDRLEEIAIKNDNSFNEQYDVQFADQYVRLGGGMYRSTCYPAAF